MVGFALCGEAWVEVLRLKNSLGQEAAQSVTVVVVPAAGITSFTSSPGSITAGGSATLSWSISNAASVSIDGIGAVTGSSLLVSPTATTTYILRVRNPLGQEAASTLTVMVLPAAGITSFTSSAGNITAGGSATLSWAVSNAASLSIDGLGAVTGSSLAVSPAVTTTYTLRAKNSLGQEAAQSVTVVVVPAAGITSFTSSPGSITAGGSATLSWVVSNAVSLSIDGVGTVTGSSVAVSPAVTTTYTLRAKNSLGSEVTATAAVTVVAKASLSFKASASAVKAGGSSTLTWEVGGATAVTLDGVSVGATGSKVVSPTGTTTYTLRATNSLGDASEASVTVEVVPLVLRWVKDIVYVGSKEVAEVDADGIHGVMTDHVGSPRFIVNGQGQVESEQKFLPFGESLTNPAAAAKFGKGFTNHEQTDPSGLIYMQARFYAPWYGRFLSPDPARDQHFEETQSWNIYSYVQNNPTMKIDPNGENGVLVAGAGILGTGVATLTAPAWMPAAAAVALVGFIGYEAHEIYKDYKSHQEATKPQAKPEAKPEAKPDAKPEARPGEEGGKALPKNPADLTKEGYRDVTDPRNTSGSRDLQNDKTGDRLRWDPGKGDKAKSPKSEEASDHYHRPNPSSTGKRDQYLDKKGQPVPRGSKPSHLKPGSE